MILKNLSVDLFVSFIALCMASCGNDDVEIFGDDFEIPALTEANTIQFTAHLNDWRTVEIGADGGRIAIDWGDNSIQKIEDPMQYRPRHTYKKNGTYRIKVWVDELVFCHVDGILATNSDFHLGYCPKMKNLSINGCNNTSSFNLENCPNLENLNIGNCEDLTSIDLSKCPNLEHLDIYTLPKLTSLNISKNLLLSGFNCFGLGLTTLSLKENINLNHVKCYENKLSSIDLGNIENLYSLEVQGNALTSLDVRYQTQLNSLNCSSNKLLSLDLSKNDLLSDLKCDHNELADLQISENNHIRHIYCNSNKLEAATLNRLFEKLPLSWAPGLEQQPRKPTQNEICFYDNSGETTCDENIIIEKNWKVIKK